MVDEDKERRKRKYKYKYRNYVPKLAYDDEIDHPIRRRVAGHCYRSEQLMLERAEYCYRSKIIGRRKVKRTYHLLYQVRFESGITVEIAYLEVGIKGYYVRYTKVKQMNWRASRKTGSRKRQELPPIEVPTVKEFRSRLSEEERYHRRQAMSRGHKRWRQKKKRQEQIRKQFYDKLGMEEPDMTTINTMKVIKEEDGIATVIQFQGRRYVLSHDGKTPDVDNKTERKRRKKKGGKQ